MEITISRFEMTSEQKQDEVRALKNILEFINQRTEIGSHDFHVLEYLVVDLEKNI